MAPSKRAQGRRVSQAPPARFPMLGLSHSPTCHLGHMERFLGPILVLGADRLTRLAVSSRCPKVTARLEASLEGKHKHLIKGGL